jgi:histidine triad (HIT) family protein
MNSCIFCKIIERKIPAKILYEDDLCLVFEDIVPQAPIHILSIPKKHIKKLSDIEQSDKTLLGHLIHSLIHVLNQTDDSNEGFRIVINNGELGGQVVNHLHVHLLGGRQMKWPPG